jgi:RNA polymerase sigma-70 factor (ECF subfamily)
MGSGITFTMSDPGVQTRSVGPIDEEAALVAELQAGSEEAFAYLYEMYHDRVLSRAYRALQNWADAEDVTEEVFIRVRKGIDQFKGLSTLWTWMFRIAGRQASNYRRGETRRQKRQPVSIEGDVDEQTLSKMYPALYRRVPSPLDLLEEAEAQETLRQALAGLPQPYRVVVVLRDIEELSFEELSQVTGLHASTLRRSFWRGRALLKKKIASLM